MARMAVLTREDPYLLQALQTAVRGRRFMAVKKFWRWQLAYSPWARTEKLAICVCELHCISTVSCRLMQLIVDEAVRKEPVLASMRLYSVPRMRQRGDGSHANV